MRLEARTGQTEQVMADGDIRHMARQFYDGFTLTLGGIPQYKEALARHQQKERAFAQEGTTYRQMVAFQDGEGATWRVASTPERLIVMRSYNDRTQVVDIISPDQNGEQLKRQSDVSSFAYNYYPEPVWTKRRNTGKAISNTPQRYSNNQQALEKIGQLLFRVRKLAKQS